ncbi:hypothetical protein QQP08_017333 [Theobroma cacao]|nr:hypothetical protein QQP08_017333 [Theobroma cacao]
MRSQRLTSQSSTLFLVAISLCFSLSSSRNPNILQRGSSLSVEDDSDMLTSADNTFTCGFYNVGENAYYFSIWRKRLFGWLTATNPLMGRAREFLYCEMVPLS